MFAILEINRLVPINWLARTVRDAAAINCTGCICNNSLAGAYQLKLMIMKSIIWAISSVFLVIYGGCRACLAAALVCLCSELVHQEHSTTLALILHRPIQCRHRYDSLSCKTRTHFTICASVTSLPRRDCCVMVHDNPGLAAITLQLHTQCRPTQSMHM